MKTRVLFLFSVLLMICFSCNEQRGKDGETLSLVTKVPAGDSLLVPELIPFRINDKWGFCNWKLELIIPAQYDDAFPFEEGYAIVSLNGKKGMIDKEGRMAVPLKYDEIDKFHEGFCAVEMNRNWGFIDSTGKEVVPLKYNLCSHFENGFAMVGKNRQYGFIDRFGKSTEFFGPFSTAFLAHCGTAFFVAENNREGFITTEDKEIFLEPMRYGNFFQENRMTVIDANQKMGFIDRDGKQVIPCIYDDGYDFSNGTAAVCLNGKWGYIDENGKTVIPFIFDSAQPFYHEYAPVGMKVIPETKDTLIAVRVLRYGYIDKKGKQVIPFEYISVANGLIFKNQITYVKKNDDEFIFIDFSGKELFRKKCGYVNFWGDGRIIFADKPLEDSTFRYGMMDTLGNVIVPPKYKSMEYESENGLYRIYWNTHKQGYIDKYGTEYWQDDIE